MFRSGTLATCLIVSLAGCDNMQGYPESLTHEANKPATVVGVTIQERQAELMLDLVPHASELTNESSQRLKNFLQRLDNVVVLSILAESRMRIPRAVRRDIRKQMSRTGAKQISLSTIVDPKPGSSIKLKVETVQRIVWPCQHFPSRVSDWHVSHSKSIGCMNARYRARQVENVGDLVGERGQGVGAARGERLGDAIKRYDTNDVKPLETTTTQGD